MSVELSSQQPLEPGTWSLDALIPGRDELDLEQRLDDLEERVARLEARRDGLGELEDSAALFDLVVAYEQLVSRAHQVAAFSALQFSADTQSAEALALDNRIRHTLTEIENRTLFISLWWQSLDDEHAGRLVAGLSELDDAEGRLADLVFYLERLRRLSPFKLDEAREQLINTKNEDGISAQMRLYTMITNAFEYRPKIDGVTEPLTRDQLMAYAFSVDAGEREQAYLELQRPYREQSKVLGQMYVHRVRDWHSEHVSLRGYASPISVRNIANDVDDDVVATLLEVVRERAKVFHRYFELKAGWLGLDRLTRYDVYAPLASSREQVPYDQAVRSVLDVFAAFDQRFGAQALRVFEEGHIDSEPRQGKRSGAFCMTVVPEVTPWVLVNYSERLRDVTTLAHEMGHAVHSMLAEGHTVLTQQPTLPLAETASVFGEMLVTQRLLETRDDPLAKREILASVVDDIYATVLRQAFFVAFEVDAHAAVASGASQDELTEIYWQNLQQQFGDAVDIDDEFRNEWLMIPHIYHSPFYCYAYSFGQLLVLALYRRYQKEGEAFVPGYLRLLEHGGSKRPSDILREVDVDIADADFWRGGLKVVEELIDQLSELS